MVKKHFYFAYPGGKSKEIKFINKYFDISKYDVIIEPFCGSSAFSYSCFNKDNTKQFVINDINDELIKLLCDIKVNSCQKYLDYCKNNYSKDTTKEQFIEIINQPTLEAFFFKNKIYNLRIGLFPIRNKNFDLNYDSYKELDNFYMSRNLEIINKDYKEIIEKHKDNEKAFIFLDPPYFLSHNYFYKTKGKGFGGDNMNKTEYTDPTAEYIYIRNALQNYKCKILMIINDCDLLKDYFKQFYKESYLLTYQMTKKKSKHMVISNICQQSLS